MKRFFLIFFTLLVIGFFSRSYLMKKGVDLIISRNFSDVQKVKVEKVYWKEGKLHLEDLFVKATGYEAVIENTLCQINWNKKPLSISIDLVSPQIFLKEKNSSPSLFFLHDRIEKVTISDAHIQAKDCDPLYLFMRYENNHLDAHIDLEKGDALRPAILVDGEMIADEWFFSYQLQQLNLKKLNPFFLLGKDIHFQNGDIEGQGAFSFIPQKGITSLAGKITIDNLFLSSQKKSLDYRTDKMMVSFHSDNEEPNFWKGLEIHGESDAVFISYNSIDSNKSLFVKDGALVFSQENKEPFKWNFLGNFSNHSLNLPIEISGSQSTLNEKAFSWQLKSNFLKKEIKAHGEIHMQEKTVSHQSVWTAVPLILFQEALSDVHVENGSCSFELVGNIDPKAVSYTQANMEVEQAQLIWKDSLSFLTNGRLTMNFENELLSQALLQLQCGELCYQNKTSKYLLSEIEGSYLFQDEQIKGSLNGQFLDNPLTLIYDSKKDKSIATIKAEANLSSWLSLAQNHFLFNNKDLIENPSIGISVQLIDREKIELDIILANQSIVQIGSLIGEEGIHDGWYHTTDIPFSLYSPFIKHSFPSLEVTGLLRSFGYFDSKKMTGFLQADNLNLFNEFFALSLPGIGKAEDMLLTTEGFASIHVDIDSKECKATIPISNGKIIDKKNGIIIEEIEGNCSAYGKEISIDCRARSDALNLKANGQFSKDRKNLILVADPTSMQNVAALLRHFESFESFQLPLDHGLIAPVLQIRENNKKLLFELYGSFESGEKKVNDQLDLKDLEGSFSFDYETSLFNLPKFKGKLLANGKTLDFQGEMQGDRKLLDFSLDLLEEKIKKARFVGQMKGEKEYELYLLKDESEFCHYPISKARCQFTKDQLLSFELDLVYDLKELGWIAPCLSACFNQSLDLPFDFQEMKLEAVASQNIDYLFDQKLNMDLHIDTLSFDERVFEPFSLHLKKQADLFALSGQYAHKKLFKGFASVKDKSVSLSSMEVQVAGCNALCDLTAKKNKDEIEGSLNIGVKDIGPIGLHLSLDHPLNFKIAKLDSLTVDEIALSLFDPDPKEFLGKCSLNNFEFSFREKGLKIKQLKLFLQESASSFLGISSSFLEGEWSCSDTSISFGKNLQLETLLNLNENILPIHFQKNNEKFQIAIEDQKEKKDLIILGKLGSNGPGITKIKGSFKGLNIEFDHPSLVDGCWQLPGEIQIENLHMLSLFSKEDNSRASLFELIHPAQFVGQITMSESNWDDLSITGDLSLSEMAYEKYHMQKGKAHIDLDKKGLLVKNLCLIDPAGNIDIKKLSYVKGQLTIPHVRVQNLFPSLLQGKNEGGGYCIRNLSLFNIQGEITDRMSFTCIGEMHVTPKDKKLPKWTDIPSEFLKDLGLDSSLFTPMQAEVGFEFKQNRFYLTKMKNAFGENRRSKFSLVEDRPSWVDLEGNLHLDFEVNVSTLFQWMDPVILSVRGDLDDMHCSVK